MFPLKIEFLTQWFVTVSKILSNVTVIVNPLQSEKTDSIAAYSVLVLVPTM